MSSILPPNASVLERALEGAVADARPDLSAIPTLLSPENCPSELLPWLAWSLLVNDWDETWPEETQRSVISTSILIHRQKGTVKSIRDSIRAFGFGEAVITEGYGGSSYSDQIVYDGSEDYGEPDHWAEYRVYLERPITIDQANQLKRILREVAPARCHLKGLYFIQASHRFNAATLYDGSYTHGVVQ